MKKFAFPTEMLIIQNPLEDLETDLTEKETIPTQSIVFKVQIITSKSAIRLTSENFNGIKNVKRYVGGSLYKYTVGETSDLENVIALQIEMQKKGFKDAFVVAFEAGKRISLKEAKKLLKQ